MKGGEATPYRIISAEMTGANELFWWVKADSPIKTLKDADGKTIAFSSPGSSSNLILLTLLKQMGSKAKPVPTGGVPGTYTQTMTGQIDIGWSVVPFALKDIYCAAGIRKAQPEGGKGRQPRSSSDWWFSASRSA